MGKVGRKRGNFTSASASTPVLPVSLSVTDSLLSDHGAPAVLLVWRTQVPQRHLSRSQFFDINRHWAVVRRQLFDGSVEAPPSALNSNLAAVAHRVLHPSGNTVVQFLLSFLGSLPDVVLNVP